MIDPITAVTVATTAFNTIHKMVNQGREIEDTFSQIGKWYGAVADFKEAKRVSDNPPMFKKLFVGKSVNEEALEILMHEKKIQKQEKQLRELLQWSYGPSGYQELVDLRRKIKDQREKTIYAQARKRKALIDNTINSSLLAIMLYTGYMLFVVIYDAWPDK